MRFSTRAGVISHKRKLSKYETTIEASFRQKEIYTVASGESSTLKTVPDMVVVPTIASPATLVLPTGVFHEDKLVEVVNSDDAAVTVGGVTCDAGEKSTLHFDGSSWSKLYAVALA